MKVSVSRESKLIGEFGEDEIQPGLQSGLFRPTDFYRVPGMVEWRPLNDFLGDAPNDPVAKEPGRSKKRWAGIEVSRETYQLLLWVFTLPLTLGLLWVFWYVVDEWLRPFFAG